MASVALSTARAMAHAQTSTTNRRALLGGLAVAPLAAQAEPAHPDAALLALEERRAAAEVLYRDAADRADALDGVGVPEAPEALNFRASDHRLGLSMFASPCGSGGMWFYGACREMDFSDADEGRCLRYRQDLLRRRQPAGIDPDPTQVRIAEIIAACDAWMEAVAKAQRDSGFTALFALAKKLGHDLKIIEEEIEKMAPLTLDGLAVKARILQSRVGVDCDIHDEAMIVIEDILRMSRTSEIVRLPFRLEGAELRATG